MAGSILNYRSIAMYTAHVTTMHSTLYNYNYTYIVMPNVDS